MSARVTRSRARSENPQTAVTDFFKTTRKSRVRGEKKIIEENEMKQEVAPPKKVDTAVEVERRLEKNNEQRDCPPAPIFEKKTSRVRNRTPSRQVELSTPEVTGTPPKKSKEVVFSEEVPVLPSESNIVLESEKIEKSAIDVLMESTGEQKKTKKVRTVTDLQARLAEKGAARAIHAQNLKNKAKQVEEYAEGLKSPKKKVVESTSPTKSKAARSLFSPKKLPEYVLPGYNVHKSAEKIRQDQDDAHDEEVSRMTSEFLKTSRLTEEVKKSVRDRIQLPHSYEHLAESFKLVDQISAIKKRSCGASELFRNVQKTSGKEFSEVHLAQILHVYPQSYNVEMAFQPKVMGEGGKYELKIRPNLSGDLEGYIVEKTSSETSEELPLVRPTQLLSPKKCARKQVQAAPRAPELNDRIMLDAARQRDRAHVFRHHLTNIVMQHHTKFLESQGLPEMPNMKRLHPLFRLDKHCPPLPQQKLPEPPVQKFTDHIGAKEAMERCIEAEQVKLPSFVQTAFNDLKSPKKTMTGATGTIPLSPKKFSEMQSEQKSKGGMSLLERIRAKEALKKAADACIDHNVEKRKQRLLLIRERYLRTVCNHFTAKKAQTMELEAVAKFIQFSSSVSSTIPDIIEHLKLLCEVAPMYVAEAVFMNKKYLRFTENNLEAIGELLDEEIQKTSQQIENQRNSKIAQMNLTPRPAKPAVRALKFH